jgi:hypothetical protein
MGWYGVRHVVKWGCGDEAANSYEERITLWRASSFEEAIGQAENEAAEYASEILGHGEVLDVFQAYQLPEHDYETAVEALTAESGVAPRETSKVFFGQSGSELFSLIRDSSLSPEAYVDQFFDTGSEHQGTMRE